MVECALFLSKFPAFSDYALWDSNRRMLHIKQQHYSGKDDMYFGVINNGAAGFLYYDDVVLCEVFR